MTGLGALERLDRMVVEAVSPDAALRLVIRAGPEATVTVAASAYRAYTATGRLERQLEAVLDQGFTVWTNTRRQLLLQAREQRRPGRVSRRPSRIDADAERITVTSAIAGARVRLSTTGLTRWRARLAEDTLAELTAAEFAAETVETVARVLAGHRRALRQLRARHLD